MIKNGFNSSSVLSKGNLKIDNFKEKKKIENNENKIKADTKN